MSDEPHVIRLRSAWNCQAIANSAPEGASQIDLPAPWPALAPCAGPARLTRRFGRPGGLEFYHTVALVVDSVAGEATVFLNGERLDPEAGGDTLEFDISERLLPRNELAIELAPRQCSTAHRIGVGDVRLEIYEG